MNVLSLFDGMSCGQIALSKLGKKIDNYYASEVDKHAITITLKNFPNTIQLGSVTDIDSTKLPKIDLLIGGSPCQSFTFAGKRRGMSTKCKVDILTLEQYLEMKSNNFEFEGESYLFWEYVRLLTEIKPKYFLLENVKMELRWKTLISKTLGVEPIFINSNLFGPQNRQRLYWTNMPVDELPISNDEVIGDVLVDDSEIISKFYLTAKHHAAFLKSYKWKHNPIDAKSKPLLASYHKQPPHCPYVPCVASDSGFRRLLPIECERLQGVSDGYTEGVSDTQRYRMLGNGWTVPVIKHILNNV